MKKKIGIVGWWGGENEGDSYIKNCLVKIFGKDFEIKLIETPFSASGWNLLNINRLDYLIIGGGGLFTFTPPSPFDTFDHWGNRLKVPFGLLGIGIQKINEEYQNTIKEIIERANFIVVRDIGSLNVLKPFTQKAIKSPDLTFLYPRRVKRAPVRGLIGINLRIWNFDENRSYDNQAWCNVINNLPGNKKSIPLSFLEGIDDRKALQCVQGEKNDEFHVRLYSDIEIMIGMRLHSLIFAVQNSIPVIGIAYTPKIKRFFYEIGLEEFCLEVDEYNCLESAFYEALKRKEELSNISSQYTLKAEKLIKKCIEDIKNKIKFYER